MVGMFVADTFSTYVNEYLLGHKYSDNVTGIAAVIYLIIWAGIGMALYERKPRP